jgi:nitrile hydratase accessory protein
LSPHEGAGEAAPLSALPRLPRDAGGPVFAEPWQAVAFALADGLCAEGHFTRGEWAAALAEELRLDARRGASDDGSHYYHCWLAALERLVVAKGLSDHSTLLAQRNAWERAYRHTPHGKPVEP